MGYLYFIGHYREAVYLRRLYERAYRKPARVKMLSQHSDIMGLDNVIIYLTYNWFESERNYETKNYIEFLSKYRNLTLKPSSTLEEELNVRIQSQASSCN